MECYTRNQHRDSSATGSAFGHESKVGQQQTKLEAKYTGDVTVGSQLSERKDGNSIPTHNGAPMYCI